MKCKGCGAELPFDSYGRMRCDYCGVQNYVPIPKVVGDTQEPVKKEEPEPTKEAMKSEPKVETQKQRVHISTGDITSNKWYLLPLLVGLIGGLIAYYKLKERDRKTAINCLYLVVISPLLSYFFFVYFLGNFFAYYLDYMPIIIIGLIGGPISILILVSMVN